MTLGLAFWILMLIWFVFGILTHYGMIAGAYGPLGNTLLLFVLFGRCLAPRSTAKNEGAAPDKNRAPASSARQHARYTSRRAALRRR